MQNLLDAMSSTDPLILEHEPPAANLKGQGPNRARIGLPLVLHAVLLSISLMTLFLASLTWNSEACHSLDASFTTMNKKTSAIKLRFNGTFDMNSPFKGPPSPAVDKAWEKILPLNIMRVSEEAFETMNASKHSVKLSEVAGGGRLALFEAFHLLHCVRALWRATHPEYYLKQDRYYQTHLEEWRAHMDHCADMLRQKLMCDADESLITYNWLKNHKAPHPNFNVQHTCKDYSLLVQKAKHDGIGLQMIPSRDDFPVGVVVDFVEPPFDPTADS